MWYHMIIHQILVYIMYKTVYMLKLFTLKVNFIIDLGTIKFKNGNIYEGEILYGNLHGKGKMIF